MITIPEGKIDPTEKLGPNNYGTRYETAAVEEVFMEEAAVSIEGPAFVLEVVCDRRVSTDIHCSLPDLVVLERVRSRHGAD